MREAAALATLAAGLAAIMGTGLQVYAVMDVTQHPQEGWSVPPTRQLIVSIAKDAIMNLCGLLAAFVVYRMQPPAPPEPAAAAAPVSDS